MVTKTMVEKLQSVEQEIASAKGSFVLFILLLKEDSEKWDLVFSSKWGIDKEKKALEYVIKKIQSNLTDDELRNISRVVFLNPSDSFVQMLNSVIHVEHGIADFQNNVINDVFIRHAYIITSKRG